MLQSENIKEEKKRIRLLLNLMLLEECSLRRDFFEVLKSYKDLADIDYLKNGHEIDSTLVARDLFRRHSKIASFGSLVVCVRFAILILSVHFYPDEFRENYSKWEEEVKLFNRFVKEDLSTLRIKDIVRTYDNYYLLDTKIPNTFKDIEHLLNSMKEYDKFAQIPEAEGMFCHLVDKIYGKLNVKLCYYVNELCAGIYAYRIPTYFNAFDFEHGVFYIVARTEHEAKLRATNHVLECAFNPFMESLTVSGYKERGLKNLNSDELDVI